jgi:EIN3-binding F-box protein
MEMLSGSSESIESIILDSCDFGLVMPLHSIEHVAQECPRLKVIKLVLYEHYGFLLVML